MDTVQKKNPAWRFLSAYYVMNVLSLMSYFYVRLYIFPASSDLTRADAAGASREGTILFCLLAVIGVKTLSSRTLDEWLAYVFRFSWVAVLIQCFLVSTGITIWYIVVLCILFVTVHQPEYQGPHNIQFMSHITVQDRVFKGKHNWWLLCAYTTWSPPCTHFAPIFADLSLRWSTNRFHFGKVDVGRWPIAAKELNISTDGASSQLPSLILFKDGKEIARLPAASKDGRSRAVKLTKKSVESFFKLETVKQESLVPIKTGGGGSTEAKSRSKKKNNKGRKDD